MEIPLFNLVAGLANCIQRGQNGPLQKPGGRPYQEGLHHNQEQENDTVTDASPGVNVIGWVGAVNFAIGGVRGRAMLMMSPTAVSISMV